MIRKENLTRIGSFTKPHGIKGEIGIMTNVEIPADNDSYIVCLRDGILVPFFIESLRPKSATVILVKLEGVDSDMAASTFTGYDVYYPTERMPETFNEEKTWNDLIDFAVYDDNGKELGILSNVDDSTPNILLQIITADGNELLIPAVDEWITDLDTEKRSITFRLPDGLFAM